MDIFRYLIICIYISALCFVDCLQNLLQSLLFLSGSRHHVYFTYNLIKNVNNGGKLFLFHKSSLNLFGTLFFKMTHSFIFYLLETINLNCYQVIQSSESAGFLPRDWFDIPAGEIFILSIVLNFI